MTKLTPIDQRNLPVKFHFRMFKIEGLNRSDILVCQHSGNYYVAIEDTTRPGLWFHLGDMPAHFQNDSAPHCSISINGDVDQWVENIIPYLSTFELTYSVTRV